MKRVLRQICNFPFGSFKFLDKYGRFCPECGYYGKLFARVPFIKKTDCDIIGGLIDPELNAYYGDVDLAMRAWVAGGSVQVCKEAKLFSGNVTDNQNSAMMDEYYRPDKQTFRKKWDGVFGEYKGGDDVEQPK